ncbi:MAG: Flp family type IVb pilin [Alphaproteobacteria bacterium]|nr:Flp family type IVb pilin [Alphaproteobacteria bacterium]
MFHFIREFIRNEAGTTVVEYGLIAALISVAAIASMQAVGGSVELLFGKVKGAMSATADA